MSQDVIWIVVNAEDTQGQANLVNAQGARELAEARIAANADMLYPSLGEAARRLSEGDRIIMHQGGARQLGGQRLVACGRIRSGSRRLTLDDVHRFPGLWRVTSQWYKYWPPTQASIDGELIIFYDLKRISPPAPSPRVIRPRPGDKFIRLQPDSVAYAELDHLWCSYCAGC